jgi:hypothetical protein
VARKLRQRLGKALRKARARQLRKGLGICGAMKSRMILRALGAIRWAACNVQLEKVGATAPAPA